MSDGTSHQAFEEAGSKARRELKAIAGVTYSMRLAAFRAYLAVALRSTPVIVPPILEAGGTDLVAVLQRLRPVRGWEAIAGIEESLLNPLPRKATFASLVGRRRPTLRVTDRYMHEQRVGDAIVSDGEPAGWIEAVAAGRHLEIKLNQAAFDLSTCAGTVRLRIRERLPDTVIASCPGGAIDRVLAHPFLDGRGFVVERAWGEDRGTVFEFGCAAMPLQLPWRD